jgi:hypothetical protein
VLALARKAFHLFLVLAAVSTLGWGDVPHRPPDSCIDKADGAACVPMRGPPGTCASVSGDERDMMELHTLSRCEGAGTPAMRCLVCVSEVYRGDRRTLRQRAASLLDAGELVGAYMALEYLGNLGECDPELGRLWFRLGKALEQAHPGPWSGTSAFRQALKCDSSLSIHCELGAPCKAS